MTTVDTSVSTVLKIMTQAIFYTDDDGYLVSCWPAPGMDVEVVKQKDCPADKNPRIVNETDYPSDQTFRDAWVDTGTTIVEDLGKCKEVCHGWRRVRRENEFKPYDDIIMKQIPGNSAVEAEAARQLIRDKYATMQTEIDSAVSSAELKTILGL